MLDSVVSILYISLFTPDKKLKDKCNDCLFTDDETEVQSGEIQHPRTHCPSPSPVHWAPRLKPLTLCKVWREEWRCRGQVPHPCHLLRLQVPRQRCGVSWSSLACWLISLTGVHSREGKVKKKGKVARSFFKEKKAWPLRAPASSAAPRWSEVFGCLKAAVLAVLRLQHKALFTWHYWKVERVKQWLITRHRRSLFLAGLCRALGIQKALADRLPKCQLIFFKPKVGSDFLSILSLLPPPRY